MVKMSKPAGPKIVTDGKMIKLISALKNGKIGKAVKRLNRQGAEMVKMLKPTGSKMRTNGKR